MINDQETSARPSRDWRAMLIEKIQLASASNEDWAMIYGMVMGMVYPAGVGAPAPSANAPSSFASSQWSIEDSGLGGRVYLTVSALPANNGFAISDIEYRRDSGLWTSVGAATTGLYEITGLTDGTPYTFRLRAQNEAGVGQQSETKTITPTTGATAVISGQTFNDVSDIVSFTSDYTGTWYWAVTATTDTPTGPQIVAGSGGGILEAGSQAFAGTTSFAANYTTLVGAHGNTRRLHYLVDPSATNIFNSNIVRQDFTVELAPAAFAVGNWYLANAATDGALTVTITALPDDNGYAINAIQYRVGGGAWVSFVGATTGNYTISGLVNGTPASIELRAANAQGSGDASDIKTETPTLAPAWTTGIVARWEAGVGIEADGTEYTSWTDSVGGLSFSTITTGSGGTTPQYQVNGSPYLKPLIYLPTGTAITVPSLAGSAFPSGDAARSFMIIAAIPTGASSGQGVMYGTNASSQAFGITINSSELPVADHWAGGTTGTTSVADAAYRSFTATYTTGTERLYVNGVEEGTASTGLTLNTALNILRAGRDLANTAENPFGLLAVVVWNVALTAQQAADAHAALAATHLAA